MLYYELLDTSDAQLASNFPSCPEAALFQGLTETLRKSNASYIYRKYDDGVVRIIATGDDVRYLASSRNATATAEAYHQLIFLMSKLKEVYSKQYRILSHNLVTTHSMLQDIIGTLVPEYEVSFTKKHSEQVEIVKKTISKDLVEAAKSVLSASKRIVDMQAQIQGFKILSGESELELGSHNISKVLEYITPPFYESFHERGIYVKFNLDKEAAEANKLEIDFKVLNVAIHHLLNNAQKYTKENTQVDINYDSSKKILVFSMKSVRIDEDELGFVFDLGFSGRNAKNAGSEGDGIGMYMVKKALDLIGAKILIQPDYSTDEHYSTTWYTKNKFMIFFQ